jgi:hypothetical protein
MNSLKRDITSGLAMSAVALVFALAYGSPFVSARAAHADDAQPPQARQQLPQDKNQQAQAAEAKTKPHPGTMRFHGR